MAGVNKIVVDESGQIKSVVVGIQGPQGPRGFQGIDLDDAEAFAVPAASSEDSILDGSLVYCNRNRTGNDAPGFKADGIVTIREIVNGGFY